ncbi:MAG: DNA translocase FtsK [Anaerolineae bacterium]|nr:DNA translocase FtsK [Anaerolineae bacterium]
MEPTMHTEVVTYWRGIIGTLVQRGELRQRTDGQKVLPQAVAVVEPQRVTFVLDMLRLGGVARETWLDPALHRQIRAALQGRRTFVADSAGLALVVAREPGAGNRRLPAKVTIAPDDLVAEGEYTVLLGDAKTGRLPLDLAGNERAMLVAGTSGSGKSGTIRSIVLQATAKCQPSRLQLALVDLKRLDFVALNALPHLVRSVATEVADAEALIGWCVQEMERRQVVMAAARVTRWDSMPQETRFPLLLLVVDECADFAGSRAVGDLVQLARKGRASGISLILATQRPDSEVLSRQIKANVPTRIAFRCTDATESRIILDRSGAEKLTRPGLALTNVDGTWRKVQCAFIPDEALGEWVALGGVIGPALGKVEVSLVRHALEHLDGAFTINPLYEAFQGRISRRQIVNLAQRWEMRGWLTAPAHATDPRRVTPELEALALGAKNGNAVTGGTGDHREAGVVTEW